MWMQWIHLMHEVDACELRSSPGWHRDALSLLEHLPMPTRMPAGTMELVVFTMVIARTNREMFMQR